MRKTIYNDVTELIGDTPLLRLNKVVDRSRCAEILGKMESFNPGGSVKDRPCFEMIKEAEAQGLLTLGATVIEPTTGNTGIGLAMICAVKGYHCILTMPEDLSLERIYLLKFYGAEVVLTPAREGVMGAIKKAEVLARKTPKSFIPLQFETVINPQAHRRTTAPEIMAACGNHLDAFVAGVGTGGTITGTGEVLKESYPAIEIVAVEPKGSAVLSGRPAGAHKIQGIGAGFVPKILNRNIIDEIITVSDQEAFDMARRLGQEEGLCVGISSGAAVVASIKVGERLGPDARVVTILCDTGERYFSVEQYFKA